ncbi:S8 family serine peptidase [Tropicibacter oceani]|uniref:S8 family serine peptidase n=1 Tax=Tropicibacter oceani TaxID=3058420 RepID=A0ABY8QK71_9RHOB|nr:S8 family serine peptidase [Tropicibacter oceani]WGW04403.1 S8 family serine peptidase [Tropicibacter oceani]
MTRFIVLRDKSGNWQRPSVPTIAAIEPTRPGEAGQPDITMLDLDPRQLREASNDPSLLAMAPVVPTRLLAPEPLDDLRADELVPGWGQRAIGADRTHMTGKGARVAILDTGVATQHPCLEGVSLIAKDFTDLGIDDANGHGTHVAGTILGRDMGGIRIGVARGTDTLLVGKTLADTGHGTSDRFLAAVLWAQSQGADVIGFALSFDTAAHIEQLTAEGYPMTLATLAAVHANRGNLRIFESVLRMLDPATRPLMVGAVGNDCLRTISPEFETGPSAPAAARGVVSIGAVGPGDKGLVPAAFSNAGPTLVAPGVGIVSANASDGVRSMNGSSMALAHALGVAALLTQHLRADGQPVNAQSLSNALIRSATRDGLAPHLTPVDRGHGLVQAPRGPLD